MGSCHEVDSKMSGVGGDSQVAGLLVVSYEQLGPVGVGVEVCMLFCGMKSSLVVGRIVGGNGVSVFVARLHLF